VEKEREYEQITITNSIQFSNRYCLSKRKKESQLVVSASTVVDCVGGKEMLKHVIIRM
jgi:hypothetical protein